MNGYWGFENLRRLETVLVVTRILVKKVTAMSKAQSPKVKSSICNSYFRYRQ